MKNLRLLRKSNNLSQEQLAVQAGVDRSTIAKWELGTMYPSADKLPLLAKILDCTIDELYEEKKEAV